MVNDIVTILTVSAILFAAILVVLLIAWVFKPARKPRSNTPEHYKKEDAVRPAVKSDLKKIKEQISGK